MVEFSIYSIIILTLIFIWVFTKNYNKEIFINLTKKDNPLIFLYSMSGYIFDMFNNKFHHIELSEIECKLRKIRILSVKKNECYVYIISKISLSIFVFMLVVLFGYVSCIKTVFTKDKVIYKINRPSYGEGSKVYNLNAYFENGYKQKVIISIPEKEYSKDEAMQQFTDCYDDVINKLIDSNKSVNNITNKLNLIEIIEKNIQIQWFIENSDYIDYEGNILWENIEKDTEIFLEATLNLGEYSQTYKIPLLIKISGKTKKDAISGVINNYIKNYSEQENEITLLDNINGEKIYFEKKKIKPSLMYIVVGMIIGGLFFVLKSKEMNNQLEIRKKQLEMDYVPIVNKITILQNAGMTILASWDKIINDYEKNSKETRYAYEEMKIARENIRNGCSETVAYIIFGKRCGIHSYIKFSNLLEQNIKKGTKGLKDILNVEVNEAFEERKILAKKKGDEASTKLLIPMGMMLIISMVIIIVPAFLSIKL